ncbi:unnamed protein product [Ixodes hexagonus]
MAELLSIVTSLQSSLLDNSSQLALSPTEWSLTGQAGVTRVPPTATSSPSVAIQVLDLLNSVYMPVVIYLGLVGNVLSLVTFLFTHLKLRTSSLYMGSLAISDSGFLFVLSFAWLNERGFNVYRRGWCRLLVFLSSAFSCCSVWLTVGFTTERFVAIRYPLWRLQLGSTRLRPKLAILATAVCSFVFNAHLLVFVGVHEIDAGFHDCGLKPEYEK